MKAVNKISQTEFDLVLTSLESKPYLVIIAGIRGSASLYKTENIKPLTEFNQSEMLKEICHIYLLDDWKKFKSQYKGFMYIFTVNSQKDLDPALFERNRIFKID